MPDQQSNPAAATESTTVFTRRQLIASAAAGGAALANLQSMLDSLRPAFDSAGKILADLDDKLDAA